MRSIARLRHSEPEFSADLVHGLDEFGEDARASARRTSRTILPRLRFPIQRHPQCPYKRLARRLHRCRRLLLIRNRLRTARPNCEASSPTRRAFMSCGRKLERTPKTRQHQPGHRLSSLMRSIQVSHFACTAASNSFRSLDTKCTAWNCSRASPFQQAAQSRAIPYARPHSTQSLD